MDIESLKSRNDPEINDLLNLLERLTVAVLVSRHALICESRFQATDRPDLIYCPEDLCWYVDNGKEIELIDKVLQEMPEKWTSQYIQVV